jgi:hypothetical protein
MGRMAETVAVVPIYSPHKAVALVMAGHFPVRSLELDGQVVAWFRETTEFVADVAKYERLRPVAIEAKNPRSPIGLTEFLEVVEKSRKV